MSIARIFGLICGGVLLTQWRGSHILDLLPTVGEQSDVHQLYTAEPQLVAFQKAIEAVSREGVTVVRADEKAGTIQGTADRGKVTVFLLIQSAKGETRGDAIACTEPGTFSHGKLDLAARILARYEALS